MRVWLVQRSEPTPHDSGGAQRILRTGIMARMLVQAGHNVVWWTSTFDHFNRRHRHGADIRLSVAPGYEIQYLYGCGYAKNVSLSRIRDNLMVAKRFAAVAHKDLGQPDIILASVPTGELALAAVEYARALEIPIILDIRDLWPDVFFDLVPRVFWPAVRFLSFPMVRKLKSACAGANGIIGITDAFVDWGVAHAGRPRVDSDRVFPMGYLAGDIPAKRIEEGKRFWRQMGVTGDRPELIVAFFGTMGKTNDLLPVVRAAKILEDKHVPVTFIICGAGERAERIKAHVEGKNNVLLPGWVNSAQIKALLELADIGIAPYIESANYINNIPNKPAEYLSGGLAIALSLKNGAMYDLLMKQKCGFSYGNRPETLALELEGLARNKSKIERLQNNALRAFRELFDGKDIYGRLIRYLEEMVHIWRIEHGKIKSRSK